MPMQKSIQFTLLVIIWLAIHLATVATVATAASHRHLHKKEINEYHDEKSRNHDERSRKHNRRDLKMQHQTSPTTVSSHRRTKQTKKQSARRHQAVTPPQLTYQVEANVVIKGHYGECPPLHRMKCGDSECIYQTCKDADSWTADGCKFSTISECESSKEWKCDCDNARGYFRLDSKTKQCVHKDDYRCKNQWIQCPSDQTKICGDSECKHQTCKDADKWTADGCKSSPISECESLQKEYKCDCDYEHGYFHLNSNTTDCVLKTEERCKNQRLQCPSGKKKICGDSKCNHHTCKDADKWTADRCKSLPISECESSKKEWKCDCDHEHGYFQLNSNAKDCVLKTEERCKNQRLQCPSGKKKICGDSKCNHHTCKDADKWTADGCKSLPISECESSKKEWKCDCDHEHGYFQLNSNAKDCVLKTEERCKNQRIQCPSGKKKKCGDSKCNHHTCKDADKWTADGCKSLPISECESSKKEWKCDCDHEHGYFQLNSNAKDCVLKTEERCKNQRLQCPSGKKKICGDSNCNHHTCKDADKWTADGCKSPPISDCESSKKEWKCDCDHEQGYFQLNSNAKDCVLKTEERCKNQRLQCPSGKKKICGDSNCNHHTCKDADKWTADGCKSPPISDCESSKKEWKCDCDHEQGYFQLNSNAKDCVLKTEERCRNQRHVIDWVRTNAKYAVALSKRAVVAGYEPNNRSPLWVIRATFRGDLIPGKLAIKDKYASVAFGADEIVVRDFEVGCAAPEKVLWLPSRDGNVPANAVIGGKTSQGEPLYIGRVRHQNSLTPGKVQKSYQGMFISFYYKAILYKQYEVLCTV